MKSARCFWSWICFILSGLLIAITGDSVAQFTIHHYGNEAGLTQGSVDYMLKDSRRFLWMSVQGGLNRFDGTRFVFYRNGQRGLRGAFVSGIVEDPNGDLWLGTEEGLNRYNRKADDFTAFIPRLNRREQVSHTHVFYADNQSVWFVDDSRGVVQFDYRENKQTVMLANVRPNMTLENNYVVLRPRQQELWMLLPTGLLRYNLRTKQQRTYFVGGPEGKDSFRSMFIDETGTCWLGGSTSLIRFQPDPMTVNRFTTPQVDFSVNVVVDIEQDALNRLWLATDGGGLLVFDKLTNRFNHHLTHQPATRQSLAMNQVDALYIDDEGIVWANTDPAGLDRITPDRGAVHYYTAESGAGNELVANATRGFAETPNGLIWIGSIDSGLSRLDPKTGQIKTYTPGNDPGSLPTGGTGAVFCDSQGRVWIGTRQGLCLYDPTRDRFETIPNTANSTPPAQYARGMWEEPGGKSLLLATTGGLFRFWPDTHRFEALNFPNERLMGSFWYDAPKKRLYVGRWLRGFDCYTYENGQLQWLYNEPLGGRNALCFYQDTRADRLWVGNVDLVSFNTKTRRVEQRFTPGPGVQPIYSLLPDESGQLWLSTNNELYRFDLATQKMVVVRQVRPQEYNSLAALKTRSGDLYLGGVMGVVRLRPDRLYAHAHPLSVAVTSLRINGKLAQFPTYIGEADTVVLSRTDNTIQIQFAAIDYQSLGNNQYRYRLVGVDRDWVESGSINSARYTNLSPGSYRFEVVAADNEGRWTPTPQILTILIRPAFWQTTWFVLLMTLLLASLGYGSVRLYLKNRLHKQRQRYQLSLDAQHTERKRLSRDLHDNIGMDLVLLKMRIDTVLINRQGLSTDEINRLQDYSAQLSRLCADVRAISHALVPGQVQEQGLVMSLELLVEQVQAAQPTLEINFTHAKVGIVPASIEQPVLQVAKELLNNTIRHAGASLVDVELERQNGTLTLTVADNGRGYDPAQLPDTAGIGLQNIQTTVMDLDGHFEVLPRPERGMVHRVQIPILNG